MELHLCLKKLLAEEEVDKLDADVFKVMQEAHDVVRDHPASKDKQPIDNATPEEVLAGYPEVQTGVEEEDLRKLMKSSHIS